MSDPHASLGTRKKGDMQMSKRYKNNAIALAVANYKQAVSDAFDTFCSGCLNRHDPSDCPHKG